MKKTDVIKAGENDSVISVKTESDLVALKTFIPGHIYFDYLLLNAEKQAIATTEDDRLTAEYQAQCWLMCQCYEVRCENNITRPLGLADIDSISGFAFNMWLIKITRADFDINFLDDGKTLEDSLHFEIAEKSIKVRIREPLAREAINIQKVSQKDASGNELTKWVLLKLFTINGEPITEEDLKTKYDYHLVALLAQKVQYFLQKYLLSETLFSLPNTQTGALPTSGE